MGIVSMTPAIALWIGASVTAGTFGPVPAALWQQRTGEHYELQARAMRRLADQPMERVRAADKVYCLDCAFWSSTDTDCAPGIAALRALFEARKEYAFNAAARQDEMLHVGPRTRPEVRFADQHEAVTPPVVVAAPVTKPLILATVPAIWHASIQPCREALNAYMTEHCHDACTLIRLENELQPPSLHPNAEYLNKVLDAIEERPK